MKTLRAALLVLVVVVGDIVTKAIATATLPPNGFPQPMLGDWLRFALVYNPGAAFGLYLGAYSRGIFIALTGGALVILWRLHRQTRPEQGVRLLAIALVTAGAIGNLIDRLRSDLGVVDFIDVGVGLHRWPTFNVADIAVSLGAMLLAWVLWEEPAEVDAAAAVTADDPAVAPSEAPQ